MKVIAHRGNLEGPNPEKENCPSYVEQAISANFDVEIDIWEIENVFYLGHDCPQYLCPDWIVSTNQYANIWFHAKNYSALYSLLKLGKHVFWHQNDNFTITSQKIIWTYPGIKEIGCNSIIVLPEQSPEFTFQYNKILGVCTDFAASWAKKVGQVCL